MKHKIVELLKFITMKANELMIGDIVAVNKTPLRIAALGTAKAGFLDAKGEMFYHYYDNIAPIQLTAEILEKNGFLLKRDDIFGWYVCCDVSLEYTADGSHNDAYWAFTCCNQDNDVCLIVMHYVHELQHALRLCGIRKEIKL